MGSITLDRGGTTVTLTEDLVVQRSSGRPGASLRTTTNELPTYIDKVRPASDVFEISGVFLSGTPEADARTLIEDILRPQFGRTSMTLTFDNGLYSLSSYNVVPEGSQAGRVTYSAGETGIVRVSSLSLRVVDNSS